MQLLHSDEVTAFNDATVYKYSRARAVLGVAGLLVAAFGAATWSIATESWLGYYLAGVFIILLFLLRKLVSARFGAANWLVRMTDHGLHIKFRSYLNHHFPAQDHTVVFIPHKEIRSARMIREQIEVPDRSDSNTSTSASKKQVSVELELDGDTGELREALVRERVQAMEGKQLDRQTTRYHHLPARLTAPDRLLIEWNVVPSAEKFLQALTRHTQVSPAEQRSQDLVNIESLPKAEQEARLLELAESGDMIGAISLARKIYGYDLAAAREFVQGLAGKRN